MIYVVVIVLAVIVLFLRHYIIRYIFTPTKRFGQKVPAIPYEDIEIKSRTGTIRGWLIKNEGSKGCFLLVHGWGSNKSAMVQYSETLYEKGYTIILIDVFGHGASDSIQKQISIETFVNSIQITIDFAEAHAEIGGNGIYVLGHSMGGLAASIVNATDARLRGLITDSIPTSLANISQSMAGKVKVPYVPFGWLFVSWMFLRAGVFLKTRREWQLEKIFMNQQSPAIAFFSVPDEKVPIVNADVLEHRSNFKRIIKVSTKGHNNCVQDERFWINVFRFIEIVERKALK